MIQYTYQLEDNIMKFTCSNDKIYRHIKLNLNDIDVVIFIGSNLNISDIWKMGISFDMN